MSKAVRAGYYWPTMREDCTRRVQTVSTTRRLAQGAARRAKFDLQPVAVSHLGNQHSGALSFGDKADEVPCSGHRVLHEMDRD